MTQVPLKAPLGDTSMGIGVTTGVVGIAGEAVPASLKETAVAPLPPPPQAEIMTLKAIATRQAG
jgi:hypothetical protein